MLIDPHAPPSPLPPHTDLLDPVPVLAFAAARTRRIRIGTGIVILPLRNPVTLAKELASIDVLSGGRLDVGIGVGYVPGEYAAMGIDFHTRGRRADECIGALRSLWHDDQPSFHGEFVSFDGIQCRPQPVQPRLPIHASGMSTAARRRAVAAVRRLVRLLPRRRSHPRRDRRAHAAARRGRAPGRPRGAGDHGHTASRAHRRRDRRAVRGVGRAPAGAHARLRRHGRYTRRVDARPGARRARGDRATTRSL